MWTGCGDGGGGQSPDAATPADAAPDACIPLTCADVDIECGDISDGCTGTITCGGCDDGEQCGLNGYTNQCAVSCEGPCPTGWSCSLDGVCVDGDLAQPIIIDVPSVEVAGSLLLDGATPIMGACTPGQPILHVRFRDAATGLERLRRDVTCDDGLRLPPTRVYPGTYVITVERAAGAQDASDFLDGPAIAASDVTITAPTPDLALAVQTVPVDGTLTYNGGPFTYGGCFTNAAVVEFMDPRTGFTWSRPTPCAPTTWGPIRLPVGTYQVTLDPDLQAPPYGDYVVADALLIDAARADLAIDVETVSVKPSLLIDGASAPPPAACTFGTAGEILFWDPVRRSSESSRLDCGDDSQVDFPEVPVYPGTYDVAFSEGFARYLPLARALEITSPAPVALNYDLATVPVLGSVLLNGADPAATGVCAVAGGSLTIRLRGETSGAGIELFVNCASAFAFPSVRLPADSYQVDVSPFSFEYMPLGRLPEPLVIDATTPSIVIDIPTITVDFRVNDHGEPLPELEACTPGQAALQLAIGAPGVGLEIATYCDDPDGLRLVLIPGLHSVAARYIEFSDIHRLDLPVGSRYFGTFMLEASGPLELDLTTTLARFALTDNGGPPSLGASCDDGIAANIGLAADPVFAAGLATPITIPCDEGFTSAPTKIYGQPSQVLVSGDDVGDSSLPMPPYVPYVPFRLIDLTP